MTGMYRSDSRSFVTPATVVSHTDGAQISNSRSIVLSNHGPTTSERHATVILDYGRCEGGRPVFHIDSAAGEGPLIVKITYSETVEGITSDTGDGPFFLFSNAMDTYRSVELKIEPSVAPQVLEARHAQRSQRYQKLTLCSSAARVTFSKIGFRLVRSALTSRSKFFSSDQQLNRIWKDGVRTVDMCSLVKGETAHAWECVEDGTRVYGQHWAPCRQGTRWTDKLVSFRVRIEEGGASWGVHMVVNGLVFCLNMASKTLEAFEGLADKASVFPVKPLGSWIVNSSKDEHEWIDVKIEAKDDTVNVWLDHLHIATVEDVGILPILGGARNSGSVAFGGPEGWRAVYRDLRIETLHDTVLYENDLQIESQQKTFADFQVGTNMVDCTIDGAKRDRSCFGGDLFVSGRSIAYSGFDLTFAAGSIELLASHQTKEGYLGNLCPVQAPLHSGDSEAPTYAFYSLYYALLLVVAIKDYWLFSGDRVLLDKIYPKLELLQKYVARHVNAKGLVEVPPDVSMSWLPMGGPIFGTSAPINLAYYAALLALSTIAPMSSQKVELQLTASKLKSSMLTHLWDRDTGILRMGTSLSPHGICQDVLGLAVSLGVLPDVPGTEQLLRVPEDGLLMAFQDLGRWSDACVVSPFATGFAVEALFTRHCGVDALQLLRRVWGVMANNTSPNYSGAHWESMDITGSPYHHDTSLVHAWSTWPVFLLPQYLTGLKPLGPNWTVVEIAPVRTDVIHAGYELEIDRGLIAVEVQWTAGFDHGGICLSLPAGTRAIIKAPANYVLRGPDCASGPLANLTIKFDTVDSAATTDAVGTKPTLLASSSLMLEIANLVKRMWIGVWTKIDSLRRLICELG